MIEFGVRAMRRVRPHLGFLAVPALVMCLSASSCGDALTPPTPPLLEGAHAAGGWSNGGCPADTEAERQSERSHREDLSPELMRRLQARYPPGTDARRLRGDLAAQGFVPAAPCDSDPSIKHMQFSQRGGGFYGPYPAFAVIAWKADAAGGIVWTKGTVAYTGP